MLCFHVCFDFLFAHMYAPHIHLISNVHLVRTFESSIPFQTFKKWHNVSYRYGSYINSETSDIWKTGAWFLKAFGESVEENHIYHLVKPKSTVKTRTEYRRCNVCYQVFLESRKINFKSKI